LQHRYALDVGDFGKLGLLRALCVLGDPPPLKLGVVWCLTSDESHNGDGKHVGYLKRPKPSFRECDTILYDAFRSLLIGADGALIPGRRRLATIETSGLLPDGTLFYGDPLGFPEGSTVADRSALRDEWLDAALRATVHADVVFLDPDNGIECASATRTSQKGRKYAFWDEVSAFAARGQTVVVYHHLNRLWPSSKQLELLRGQFKERMPHGFLVSDVVFRRGTRRAYFVAAAPQHRELVARRLSGMLATRWSRHFPPELANLQACS
jgi:hypothetical protein